MSEQLAGLFWTPLYPRVAWRVWWAHPLQQARWVWQALHCAGTAAWRGWSVLQQRELRVHRWLSSRLSLVSTVEYRL